MISHLRLSYMDRQEEALKAMKEAVELYVENWMLMVLLLSFQTLLHP